MVLPRESGVRVPQDSTTVHFVDKSTSKGGLATKARLKRSSSFGSRTNVCACGKVWVKGEVSSRQRFRNHSHSHFHLQQQSKSRTRSSSVGRVDHSICTDLEDIDTTPIEQDASEIVSNIIKSEPRINLTYEKEVEDKYCSNCKKSTCLLVTKTPGYYHPDQLKSHRQASDCWVTAHGIVYDVTRYLKKHPGGARSILNVGGQDVSIDYNFHSKRAQKAIWSKYAIGKLAFCDNGIGKQAEACCIS